MSWYSWHFPVCVAVTVLHRSKHRDSEIWGNGLIYVCSFLILHFFSVHVCLCVSTSYSVHLEVRGHLGEARYTAACCHSSWRLGILHHHMVTLFSIGFWIYRMYRIPNIASARIIYAHPYLHVEYSGRSIPKAEGQECAGTILPVQLYFFVYPLAPRHW